MSANMQFEIKQGGGPPPGFYKTKFVTIEPSEHEEYGSGLKFVFEVTDGEHAGNANASAGRSRR